ncbi:MULTISPECIES: DUF885 domain-containing protein [Shewanella]|uniref:DUF885 domain-containing protein n=2 Tax=Shewanella TaxID=22 RepID=A0A974XPC2_9GAMM|nr:MULTISPECIES: DUF885 domain-containing protein [Shewanella]QSX30958.1 DUF885 domain-containing protein [Shewanella cyperi]QSX38174.1 DUF885 domain-containing protein [Shewanella sedimentimangrovi]QSX41735.1 DUF885 domain-containing protein [Shewanella cyperi]
MSNKFPKTLVALGLCAALGSITIAEARPLLSANESIASETRVLTESAKANELFETLFMEDVMASPLAQTELGIKTADYGKWDEISEAADARDLARAKKQLQQLKQVNEAYLDAQTALSLSLYKQQLEDNIADYKWHLYNYPVNQMYGVHSTTPSTLINQHQIGDESDARAYISRLKGIYPRFEQVQAALELRAEKGIIAPKFVFNYVISDSRNIITGAPFTEGEDSALWADFKRKIEALQLDEKLKSELLAEARTALLEQVKPAYEQLIDYVAKLQQRADDRDGVWKFPQGDAFYRDALKRTTTTDMSADEIHRLGLAEVERIHGEMRAIMTKVGFKGSLKDFFIFMRNDEQFYYPDNAEGKAAYLSEAKSLIDTMRSRLDEVFSIKPKAGITVKAVEAFREKSAGKAFYNQPSADGSRPGIFYANLYSMKAMPKYQMEALAYHEGIPGHHMQIAIAQELENVPKFRRFGRYTAYVEGWGLYTEYFPKEMGLYKDPYSDFGRLAMELWRACRLVVDTGIHAKQWTREQGIAYYTENTPNAESDAVKMVERHIVMPSQATAYKVGMNKILALRAKAQKAMGDKFNIREFHTLLLKNGPLPLDVLESQIDDWIKSVSIS